jgi:hypothetical protein
MLCKDKCRECSYLTCNFHPLFHLTRQYVNSTDAGVEPSSKTRR